MKDRRKYQGWIDKIQLFDNEKSHASSQERNNQYVIYVDDTNEFLGDYLKVVNNNSFSMEMKFRMYLNEPIIPHNKVFDILLWRKQNNSCYKFIFNVFDHGIRVDF